MNTFIRSILKQSILTTIIYYYYYYYYYVYYHHYHHHFIYFYNFYYYYYYYLAEDVHDRLSRAYTPHKFSCYVSGQCLV